MRWFKHLTGAHDDPDFHAFFEKTGDAGKVVFFETMEIMAKEFDITRPGVSYFSKNFLVKGLNKQWRTLEKVYFEAKKIPKKKGIYSKVNGNGVLLNCPTLKKLADEYTEKQLKRLEKERQERKARKPRLTPDTSRDSLQPIEQDTDIDKEGSVIVNKSTPTKEDLKFQSLSLLVSVGVPSQKAKWMTEKNDLDYIQKVISYCKEKYGHNVTGSVIRALEEGWTV